MSSATGEQLSDISEAWPILEHHHAGWVPTITGNLSFSLVGSIKDKKNLDLLNVEGKSPPTQYVVALQRRMTKDRPLYDWLIKLFDPSAVKDYVLIAKTNSANRCKPGEPKETFRDAEGVLEGDVHIFFHFGDRKDRERYKGLRNSIIGEIKSGRADQDPFAAAAAQVAIIKLLDSSAREANALARKTVRFRLYRSGEIRLWGVSNATNADAKDDVDPVSVEEDTKNFLEECIHLTYGFVKDLTHKHYHHDENSDRLALVSAASPSDDSTWRRETLWSLSRMALEIRRRDLVDNYRRASGIIAYAEAFQSCLASHVRSVSNYSKFEPMTGVANYDFEHAHKSMLAKEGELTWDQNMRASKAIVVITLLLGLFATWIGAVQIGKNACEALGVNQAAHSGVETLGAGGATSCVEGIPIHMATAISFIVHWPIPIAAFLCVLAWAKFEHIYHGMSRLGRVKPKFIWLSGPVYAIAINIGRVFTITLLVAIVVLLMMAFVGISLLVTDLNSSFMLP